jgi:hypothetical protein
MVTADARYGMHQGTPIPWPQCHNALNSMGDDGPARTLTWDQGNCVMAIFQPLTGPDSALST